MKSGSESSSGLHGKRGCTPTQVHMGGGGRAPTHKTGHALGENGGDRLALGSLTTQRLLTVGRAGGYANMPISVPGTGLCPLGERTPRGAQRSERSGLANPTAFPATAPS